LKQHQINTNLKESFRLTGGATLAINETSRIKAEANLKLKRANIINTSARGMSNTEFRLNDITKKNGATNSELQGLSLLSYDVLFKWILWFVFFLYYLVSLNFNHNSIIMSISYTSTLLLLVVLLFRNTTCMILSFLIIFSGTQTLACKKIEMACQDFEPCD
jgi:hypothetical protein